MDIFVQSGLSKQITLLPSIIETGIVNSLKRQKEFADLPYQFTQNYLLIARNKFTVDYLSDSILAYLDTQFTILEMQQVLKWLNSDFGRKVTQLEKHSTSPKNIRDMRAYALQLQNAPPPADRLRLIHQLNRLTRASESSLLILMTSRLAVTMAKLKLNKPKETLSVPQILKQIAHQRPELEKETFHSVISGLLYTYQSVNDEELKQYIKFANSSIGQKYHQAILGAYNSALIDASTDFGLAVSAM